MSSITRVSAREAFALLSQGYVYLDVRTVPEFHTGHPRGAYNIPVALPGAAGMQENAQFVTQVKAAFGEQARLVVGCAAGVRSMRAAELLLAAGVADLVELRPGLEGVRDPFGRLKEKGYRAEGLPIATEPEPGHTFAELTASARPIPNTAQ